VSEPFEITAGVRWDYTRAAEKPAYNPAIDAAFGRRTDVEPVVTTLTPRLGFNYRVAPGDGLRSARTISGGIGVFAGQTPSGVFAAANRQTGLTDAERNLVCIGAATPFPDWDLYLSDQSAIPATCGDGSTGSAQSSRLPTVALINPDQSVPASLRAELGYRTRIPLGINANVRYRYARGFNLWGYYDINLDASKFFQLGSEQRPYFGDASAIVNQTGQTTLATSRLFPQFGHVYDIRADRSSSTHQVTTELSGRLPKGVTLAANYTLSFARDQGSGEFRSAPTAGNPNQLEWSASSQDRRHTINLTLAKAITQEFELTAIARLSSGAPFTPMVGGDVNGDGVINDRAYVFNPASTADSSLANSMSRLLASAPGRIADCLTSQLGNIAERNSCRNAWSRSLDMRASLRPNLPRLQRRLTISVDANNVLNGLDQLFNGDQLKGWGENQRVDSRLLEVRGFDAITNAFVYDLNEAFGQNRRGPSSIRNPFALRINARIAIGGQSFQNNRGFGAPIAVGADFGRIRGGAEGGGGFGGGGDRFGGMMGMLRGEAGAADPDSVAARAFTNPIRSIIERRDSIELSEMQVARLTTLADTLDRQLDGRRDALRTALSEIDLSALARRRDRTERSSEMDAGGPPAEVERAQRALQPVLEAGRKDISNALERARTLISAQQWQKLPFSLRVATAGSGRGGFNVVGLIDRMLANPIPVLLELKDTLALTPEQTAKIGVISSELQDKLSKRREDLGRKLNDVSGSEQGRMLMEMQPAIEATRREIASALKQVQAVLTEAQWQRVPEPVRNPFQRSVRRPRD
jgi:hypothetical protein